MNEIPDYQQHHYSEIFPLVSADSEEYALLSSDIAKHGLINPAVIYQGQILDGYTRYRICKSMPDVEFTTTIFQGNDEEALAFVLSANLRRRHLTETARAMAACRWLIATGKDSTKETKKLAAGLFNSSKTMIEYAASIFEKGNRLLLDAVDSGSCKLSTAKKLIVFNNEEIERALNDSEYRKDLFASAKLIDENREFSNGIRNEVNETSGTDHVYGVIYTDYDTGVDLPAASNCVVYMWASADDLYLAVDRLIDAEFIDGKIYNFIRLTNGKMTSANVEHLICATKGTVPSLPVFQQNMVLNMKTGRPIQYAEVIGQHYTVPILAMFTNQIKHKGDHWEYEPPLTIVEKPVKRNGNGKKAKTTTETETTEETTTTETA